MVSQICVVPEFVPTARWLPCYAQATEVIESSSGTSQSFLTWLVHADQI